MKVPAVLKTLKTTASEWSGDKVPTLGAALAYYTIFSMAPLIMIAIAVAGLVIGRDAASSGLVSTFEELVGKQGAQAVSTMIENAQRPASGALATIIGVVTLLFGASGAFAQLQDTLNAIWKVQPKPNVAGWWTFLRARLFSFGMVVAVGFLLLASLVLTSALSAVGRVMSDRLPGGELLWQVVNFAVAVAVEASLFALIFKVVPDVKLRWRDVAMGGVLTAILFTIGKFAIGLYIGHGAVSSVYGAAGSFIVVLLWVYYTSQIMFFGAEYTKVRTLATGKAVEPEDHAEVRATPPPGEARSSRIDRRLVKRLRRPKLPGGLGRQPRTRPLPAARPPRPSDGAARAR